MTIPEGLCPGGGGWIETKQRKISRCPSCNRRLLPAEVHCAGGELLGFRVPPHKPKAKTKKKRPSKRQ